MVTPWYAAEKLTLSDRPDAHKFPWRRHFSSDSDYLFTGRRARDGRAATTVCASAHLSCPGPPLSPWLIIMQAWRQRARWYYWNIIYEAEIKFNVPCVRMRARVCVCGAVPRTGGQVCHGSWIFFSFLFHSWNHANDTTVLPLILL